VTVRRPGASAQPVSSAVKMAKPGAVKQPLARPVIASHASGGEERPSPGSSAQTSSRTTGRYSTTPGGSGNWSPSCRTSPCRSSPRTTAGAPA